MHKIKLLCMFALCGCGGFPNTTAIHIRNRFAESLFSAGYALNGAPELTEGMSDRRIATNAIERFDIEWEGENAQIVLRIEAVSLGNLSVFTPAPIDVTPGDSQRTYSYDWDVATGGFILEHSPF